MKCNICYSSNIKFLGKFKPYLDKEWYFDIFDCLNCGVRFAKKEDFINYYETFYSSPLTPYSFYFQLADVVKKYLDKNQIKKCEKFLRNFSTKYRIIIDFFNKRKLEDKKILEVGCSTGFLTAFLKAKGFNIVGIDISQKAINEARTKFGEFFGTEEKKEKYDVIFFLGLIGCVEDPKKFITHYLSLLKQHGIIIFNAPSLNMINPEREIWIDTPPPDLGYLFTKKSLFYLTKQEGFAINVKITPIYNYVNIFKKNINFLLNSTSSIYPRNFSSSLISLEISFRKHVLRELIKILTYLLTCFGFFKKSEDEFFVEITKK